VKVVEVPHDDREPFTAEEQASFAKRQAKRDAQAARQRDLEAEARHAVERAEGRAKKPRRKTTPKPVERRPLEEIPVREVDAERTLGVVLGKDAGKKAYAQLVKAADAFEAGRYLDAIRMLRSIAERAPEVAEVRELLGLSLYRRSKWSEAAKELERFRSITGTAEQHPVLADCYRALGRWADVEIIWDELRAASPSASLVTEGRVVVAGALADQGDISGAIMLLEKKWKRPKRPYEHHLSRAYALADLYERGGDGPRATELFAWVARQDPSFSDAAQRSQR